MTHRVYVCSTGIADEWNESKGDVLQTLTPAKSDNDVGPRVFRVKMRGSAANHMDTEAA